MSSRGAPSQFSQFSVRIQLYNSAIHELRTDAILKNAFCLADIFRSHSTPSHFHSITQGKECNVHDVPFPWGSCRTMPGGLGSHRPSLAVASGPDHPARARGVDACPCSAGVRCAASAGAVSRLLANNSPRATPAAAPRAAGERAPASTARRTAHPLAASQPPTREPRRRRRAPRSYTRWDSCRYCVYPTRRKAAVASATQGCTEPARGGNAHSLCRR